MRTPLSRKAAAAAVFLAALSLLAQRPRSIFAEGEVDASGASAEAGLEDWVPPFESGQPGALADLQNYINNGAGRDLVEKDDDLRAIQMMDSRSAVDTLLFAGMEILPPKDYIANIQHKPGAPSYGAYLLAKFPEAKLKVAPEINARGPKILAALKAGQLTEGKLAAANNQLRAFSVWSETYKSVAAVNSAVIEARRNGIDSARGMADSLLAGLSARAIGTPVKDHALAVFGFGHDQTSPAIAQIERLSAQAWSGRSDIDPIKNLREISSLAAENKTDRILQIKAVNAISLGLSKTNDTMSRNSIIEMLAAIEGNTTFPDVKIRIINGIAGNSSKSVSLLTYKGDYNLGYEVEVPGVMGRSYENDAIELVRSMGLNPKNGQEVRTKAQEALERMYKMSRDQNIKTALEEVNAALGKHTSSTAVPTPAAKAPQKGGPYLTTLERIMFIGSGLILLVLGLAIFVFPIISNSSAPADRGMAIASGSALIAGIFLILIGWGGRI